MLDKKLNYVPENIDKIHLISACGTGMGALASMLKDLGYSVSGSDHGIYPPMSTFLFEKGIELFDGFDEKNISDDIDLVIVGNAVTKDNIEAKALCKKKLNYVSMPQAINHFFAKDKKIIMVTGTHGKTTTTGLISHILEDCEKDPSFFIGGIHKNFNSGYKVGKGDYIVIEGDEYDTAFFDKESKFLHFNPHRLVITGIEFDHADIFKDISHIKKFFFKLITKTDDDCKIFSFDSSHELRDLLQNFKDKNIAYYGYNLESEIFYQDKLYSSSGIEYNYCGKKQVFIPMSGDHNIFNSLAAISVCLSLGIEFNDILCSLKNYKGMKRRQELRGEVDKIKIIDDFAHHPTEVKFTIKGIKDCYKPNRLISVFEPRTNTSMRDVFQTQYEDSFHGSNLIIIREPSRLDKVPKDERFSSKKLVANLLKKGFNACYYDNTDDIIKFLIKESHKDDLILIMSNGGFDNIHKRLIDGLKNR